MVDKCYNIIFCPWSRPKDSINYRKCLDPLFIHVAISMPISASVNTSHPNTLQSWATSPMSVDLFFLGKVSAKAVAGWFFSCSVKFSDIFEIWHITAPLLICKKNYTVENLFCCWSYHFFCTRLPSLMRLWFFFFTCFLRCLNRPN